MVTKLKDRHNPPTVGFAMALLVISLAANTISEVFGQQQQQPQQKQFVAKLSAKNEVPPVNTTATGTANFTVNPNEQSLRYILTVHNITGAIGADIHWGTAYQDGPVIISLFNSSTPTGKVNGILAKGTITSSDIKGNMTSKPGFMEIVAKGTMSSKPSIIHVQGLVGSVSDLIILFTSSNAYVNVHTQMHNNGEIRGQIGPVGPKTTS
jgi:CHRD domain-containing protein